MSSAAIAAADRLAVGSGRGPLHHFLCPMVGFREPRRSATALEFPRLNGGDQTMLSKLTFVTALALLLAVGHACATEYEIVNHADLVFAEHDGTKLVGDLCLPKVPHQGAGPGGRAWRRLASRRQAILPLLGPVPRPRHRLRGFHRRLSDAGKPTGSIRLRFTTSKPQCSSSAPRPANSISIRIASGSLAIPPAPLASLVALAGDEFNSAYRDDAGLGCRQCRIRDRLLWRL